MQILPITPSAVFDQFAQSTDRNAEEQSTFMDELIRQQDARDMVADGNAFSVETALQDSGDASDTPSPLAQAPYNQNTADGVTYSLEEVNFTKQELQDLQRELAQAGAPVAKLNELQKLADQPDGASLSQVMASLQANPLPPQLTDADTQAITQLTSTIDATGALGEKVLQLLQQGKGKQAWEAISAALQKMPAGTTLQITKNEVAALTKAMGVSNATAQKIMSNFGRSDSISISTFDFDRLMTPAQNAFMQQEKQQEAMNKALQTTLQPLLTKAKNRMEKEKAASALATRRASQSQTMIQDTVMRKVNDTLNKTQDQAHNASDANAVFQQNAQKGEHSRHNKTHDSAAQTQQEQKIATDASAQDTRTQTTVKNTAETPMQGKNTQSSQNSASQQASAKFGEQASNHADQQDFAENFAQQQPQQQNSTHTPNARSASNSKDNPWTELLQKTEVRSSVSQATPLFTNAVNGIHGQEAMATAKAEAQVPVSRQVLSQVEQAVLSGMKNGSTKLQLTLNPVDLGTLTLTLTARNGEVSATIRSEKGETAEMLTRQLDVIRTNLEQQGVKIDKLEVQNQSANNDQQQWESMQQHNARQEEYARRDTLDRLRSLAKVRNSSENDIDETLEQSLQYTMRTATNAEQGIYIVA